MLKSWENWGFTEMPAVHTAVLQEEVLSLLNPKPGQTFIDATINGGGHAEAILASIVPGGTLLGMDWDCELVQETRRTFEKMKSACTVSIICASYVSMQKEVAQYGIRQADGILFDLGFSSYHVDRAGRGFSFMRDEPLDMRYNIHSNDLTARQIINEWPEDLIADIVWRYGEERWARRIAQGIARARVKKEIVSSKELSEIITRSIPRAARSRVHPATRTFQALRIAVNHELESLEQVLPEATQLLAPGGRLAVISFHSLEDRVVKTFFKAEEKRGILRIMTKKPIRPREEEIHINPRARSARLRGAIKI